MSYNWGEEPLRTKLREIFGEERALEIHAALHEYLLMPVTILNDENLKQSGIYEPYSKETGNKDSKKDYIFDPKDSEK